jgi:hypothetical protein
VVEQVNARFRKFKLIGERFPHQSVAQLPHWCAIAIALLNEEDCYKPYYANSANVPDSSDECVNILFRPRPDSLESKPIPDAMVPCDDSDCARKARAKLCGERYSQPPVPQDEKLAMMEQGTEEWKEERGGKVCASTVAPLAGLGKFKTQMKQWKLSTGRATEAHNDFKQANFDRGQHIEEVVRCKLPELMEGALEMKVQVKKCGSWYGPASHPERTLFLASPDGIIEISFSPPPPSTNLAPAPLPAVSKEEDGEMEVEDKEDDVNNDSKSYCLLEVKGPQTLSEEIDIQYVLQVHMQCWCTGLRQCLLIQAVEKPAFAIKVHLFQIKDAVFNSAVWVGLLNKALSVLRSPTQPKHWGRGERKQFMKEVRDALEGGEDVTNWFRQDISSLWALWSSCTSFAPFSHILPCFPKLPFAYIKKVLRVLSLRHASDASTIRRARKHFLNQGSSPFTAMEYLYNLDNDILILKCKCPASMYCGRTYQVAVYFIGLFTPTASRAGDGGARVVTPKCVSLCSCVNGPSGNCGHIATLFCVLSDLNIQEIRNKHCQRNRYERGLQYQPHCCTSPPGQ